MTFISVYPDLCAECLKKGPILKGMSNYRAMHNEGILEGCIYGFGLYLQPRTLLFKVFDFTTQYMYLSLRYLFVICAEMFKI